MKRLGPLLSLAVGFAWSASPVTAADEAPESAWSLPLIDLAGETDRQVVVDREPGQYLGHPTTVLLEDGETILTVYPKGHGSGPIVYKRSDDGGRTWSDRLPVPDNWATSKETPTIHRVVDAEGVKRLIVFSSRQTKFPDETIRMAVSEDDGRTWTPLRSIGDYGGVVAMASLAPVKTGAGHYLGLFHDRADLSPLAPEPAKDRSVLLQVRSTDGGLTWSEPELILSHETAFLCEPGAVRSPDGKRLAMLLRENNRRHRSMVMFSDDEGKTWSEPRELPAALTGDRHVAKYAPDGRLFISFRDRTKKGDHSPTAGDWVAWVGTWDDLVSGAEGQYRVRLMDNHEGSDCAYPGVEVLADGAIVAVTYGHWTEGEEPWIAAVRLTLDELDERAGGEK